MMTMTTAVAARVTAMATAVMAVATAAGAVAVAAATMTTMTKTMKTTATTIASLTWFSCPTGPNRRGLVVAQRSSAIFELNAPKQATSNSTDAPTYVLVPKLE